MFCFRNTEAVCPVNFPKTIPSFGIVDIHGSNQGTLFDFKRLDSNRAASPASCGRRKKKQKKTRRRTSRGGRGINAVGFAKGGYPRR
jgi:hypothetical protein